MGNVVTCLPLQWCLNQKAPISVLTVRSSRLLRHPKSPDHGLQCQARSQGALLARRSLISFLVQPSEDLLTAEAEALMSLPCMPLRQLIVNKDDSGMQRETGTEMQAVPTMRGLDTGQC